MFHTLISAAELLPHLQEPDWVIVDCRFSLQDPEKGFKHYREGHIPGAFYAHLDRDLSGTIIPGKTGRHPLPEVETLTKLFSSWGIGPDSQVVAYDYKSGGIAARLWWMLRWLGHSKAAVLDGGWAAWMEKKSPKNDQIPKPPPGSFQPQIQKDWLVEVDTVDRIRKDPDFCLVDSRVAARYRGEEEPIDPVAGHIPGAVNAPFSQNVDEQGFFQKKEVLNNRFERVLNGKKADHAVFYCGSGVTACHNLLALQHAGMGNGKLYAGSWSEWITDPEREIA